MRFHVKHKRRDPMVEFLTYGRALMLRDRRMVVQALMSSSELQRVNALCALRLVEWTEEHYLSLVADLGLKDAPRG